MTTGWVSHINAAECQNTFAKRGKFWLAAASYPVVRVRVSVSIRNKVIGVRVRVSIIVKVRVRVREKVTV